MTTEQELSSNTATVARRHPSDLDDDDDDDQENPSLLPETVVVAGEKQEKSSTSKVQGATTDPADEKHSPEQDSLATAEAKLTTNEKDSRTIPTSMACDTLSEKPATNNDNSNNNDNNKDGVVDSQNSQDATTTTMPSSVAPTRAPNTRNTSADSMVKQKPPPDSRVGAHAVFDNATRAAPRNNTATTSQKGGGSRGLSLASGVDESQQPRRGGGGTGGLSLAPGVDGSGRATIPTLSAATGSIMNDEKRQVVEQLSTMMRSDTASLRAIHQGENDLQGNTRPSGNDDDEKEKPGTIAELPPIVVDPENPATTVNADSSTSHLVEAFTVPEVREAIIVDIQNNDNATAAINHNNNNNNEEEKSKPWYQNPWILVVVLLAIALAVTIGVVLSGNEKNQGTEIQGGIDEEVEPPMIITERTIQIIHTADNDSDLVDPNTLERKVLYYSSLVEGLRQLGDSAASIHIAGGDLIRSGPFYKAAAQVESLGHNGLGDIAMFNAMYLDAAGLGNFELNQGMADFAILLDHANFPFVATTLDFSRVVTPDGIPDIGTGDNAVSCSAVKGMVVKSCYIETPIGNVGLIGRPPNDLFNIIQDPQTTLSGLDFVGGRDPDTGRPRIAPFVLLQEQIQLLQDTAGVDIIILLDQDFDLEGSFDENGILLGELDGIDIIIGESSQDTLFAQSGGLRPFNVLRPGDTPAASYPNVRRDANDNQVLLLNSGSDFRYIGNLMVRFDENGHAMLWDGRSGPIATTQESVQQLASVVGAELTPPLVQPIFDALWNTPSIQDSFQVVGTSVYPLQGDRQSIRTRETNFGSLVSDSLLWYSNEHVTMDPTRPVQIALKNAGGIRNSIEGPQITRLSIQSALPFDNSFAIVEMTGGQLLAALENSVSVYPQRDGRFLQVAGIKLEFNASKPGLEGQATIEQPSRIRAVALLGGGEEEKEDVLIESYQVESDFWNRTFVVATDSFLQSGGDFYESVAASTLLSDESEIGEQVILEEYIVSQLGGMVTLHTDIPENEARIVIVD